MESLDPDGSIKDKIAAELRFWRELKGLSMAQISPIMGVQRTAVSNYERSHPKFNLQMHHAKNLDDHYGLGDHFQWLVRRANAEKGGDYFSAHLKLERSSRQISTWDQSLINGLLQTPAYARQALIDAGSMDLDNQLNLRLARQEVVDKQGPALLWVLMDESVLDRMVGGWEVMGPQLEKLVMMSELPHVSLRIVPLSAGWHPGVFGSFKLLDVVHDRQKAARRHVYREISGAGDILSSRTDVDEFTARYQRIGAKALPEQVTRELIKATLESAE